MSENDYLKEIPLSEVAVGAPDAFVDGPFGSNLKSAEYTDDGVRLIQLQNIGVGQWLDFNKKFVSKRKLATLARHAVRAGDIAIAKMAEPVARACVVPPVADDFMVVADCIKLRVDEAKADPRFVVYLLNSYNFRTQAERHSIGTTRIRINLSVLKNLEIAVPGLAAQHRIAEILDTADEAIHSTERLIAKLEQAKQGLLHDLLTRGIHETGRLRDPRVDADQFNEGPLGWLPRSWRICEIGAACSLVVDCPHTTPIFREEGILVARTTNIRDGRFISQGASYVDLNEYCARIIRAEPQPGDLIFTREAPVGEAFVIPPRMRICLGQRVMLLRPDPKMLDSVYMLSQIYSGFVRARISVLTAGTTNPHLNVGDVRKFLIPVPAIDEQRSIAKIVSKSDAKIHALSRELHKFRLLKQGLMDDLLTGKVRVGALG